jgi:hypothetical protein
MTTKYLRQGCSLPLVSSSVLKETSFLGGGGATHLCGSKDINWANNRVEHTAALRQKINKTYWQSKWTPKEEPLHYGGKEELQLMVAEERVLNRMGRKHLNACGR